MTFEPRWDRDLAYGKQGELLVGEYLDWVAAGNGRVEVKRKRNPDMNFYVEHEHDPGRRGHYCPSGISVTTADAWAFLIADTGVAIIIPTALLKDGWARSTRVKEERDGSCPTRGHLVNLGSMFLGRATSGVR